MNANITTATIDSAHTIISTSRPIPIPTPGTRAIDYYHQVMTTATMIIMGVAQFVTIVTKVWLVACWS